jgi:hypothetical protein
MDVGSLGITGTGGVVTLSYETNGIQNYFLVICDLKALSQSNVPYYLT